MVSKKILKLERLEKVSLSINILVLLSLFLLFRNYLPPEIPLFFGMPQGADQLAPKSFIFLLPLVAIIILVINHLAIIVVKDNLLKKLFIFATMTASFMTAYCVFQIFGLVGSLK